MSYDIIRFNHVSKIYSRYFGLMKLKNFLDRVKNGQIGRRLMRMDDIVALNDISFSVEKGERVGIIGRNGAGKSTILKLMNHTMFPTKGTVHIDGSVGGLIELTGGFHSELSGRDNVYLNAAILGFSSSETKDLMGPIITISGLKEFIDVPVKKYSSGMKVRLGFAIAMATSPDIVLLDEVLAVGDAEFRTKSMRMMETYLEDKTLVFVSHNMKQVQQICTRILILNEGGIAYDGDVEEGIERYYRLMDSSQNRRGHTIIPRNLQKGFSEEPAVAVETLSITNFDGMPLKTVRHGQKVVLRILLQTNKIISDLKLKVMVKRSLMDTFSDVLGQFNVIIPRRNLELSKEIAVSFRTDNLSPGEHVVEIVPEFVKQPARSALDSYSETFEIVSDTEQEADGLINLNFTIEE
ncbi:MAG: ATP-binding cassette domain-containing protein [Spirochaetes bacterium]|nr:ATP-binding cassette domain-containing protein [Spirochaetota bacterium]